eukprot:TRINITY_DN33159_c0_g1_i2.p1 TRINITY_DN33159_c0_g1~~TRINITY_DN33159_c0_g1_i2.p1  ORF type:complete len:133 (-),score=22.98 TRINITY_DN33159_c0_g1_i2:120-518(-)
MGTRTKHKTPHTTTTPPIGKLMDDLRAELGCNHHLHPHGGGAARPHHSATSTTLTVEQRRSVVEASKLLPTSSLTGIPAEGDDAALNAMAREYLAHYGYADTIAALDRVAPPKAVHNDTAILRDKKLSLIHI